MRQERNEIKIGGLVPYDVSKYDNVFVVLKDYNAIWKERIRYSEEKKKYFLKGKIIQWSIESEGGQHTIRSYPKEGTLAFVDHKDWNMYSTCKYEKEKEKKIMHIHYSCVDFILLDFNSLDWKR